MQAGQEASPSRHDGSRLDAADEARVLYRHMLTLRLLSARMVDLQRTSKVALHTSCLGEEAVIAAATLAARASDWVFPGAREWGAAIVRGLPIEAYVHHAFGTIHDAAKGHSAPDHPPARMYRVAPASGVAGAHVPQAVGAAWAAKIKKDDVATVAIFGDAANGTGDLHNALVQIKALRKNVNKTFYDIGAILRDIQARRLYEAKGYGTFEAFLEREIDLGKTTSLRLVRVASIFQKEAALEHGMDRVLNALLALEMMTEDGKSGKIPPPPPSTSQLPLKPPGR